MGPTSSCNCIRPLRPTILCHAWSSLGLSMHLKDSINVLHHCICYFWEIVLPKCSSQMISLALVFVCVFPFSVAASLSSIGLVPSRHGSYPMHIAEILIMTFPSALCK